MSMRMPSLAVATARMIAVQFAAMVPVIDGWIEQ
jgi:hypothetical protein